MPSGSRSNRHRTSKPLLQVRRSECFFRSIPTNVTLVLEKHSLITQFWRPIMKRHLLLTPMILAATAAIADAQTTAPSTPADAQALAAALLSRPHTRGAVKADARSL